MDTVLFREAQGMTGAAMLVVVIVIVLVVVGAKYRTMKTYQRVSSAVALLIVMFTAVILFTLRLDTVYYTDHVEHRFSSIYGARYDKVSLDSVAEVKVLTYDPADYGGWGAKGNEDTRVFNASGNKGILFTFRSGKMLLLGTHQPDTLYARLKGYYPFK